MFAWLKGVWGELLPVRQWRELRELERQADAELVKLRRLRDSADLPRGTVERMRWEAEHGCSDPWVLARMGIERPLAQLAEQWGG